MVSTMVFWPTGHGFEPRSDLGMIFYFFFFQSDYFRAAQYLSWYSEFVLVVIGTFNVNFFLLLRGRKASEDANSQGGLLIL